MAETAPAAPSVSIAADTIQRPAELKTQQPRASLSPNLSNSSANPKARVQLLRAKHAQAPASLSGSAPTSAPLSLPALYAWFQPFIL